jgi:hypothetical protein
MFIITNKYECHVNALLIIRNYFVMIMLTISNQPESYERHDCFLIWQKNLSPHMNKAA